ncbi:MAG TPA: hypothetical protein VEY07_06395 [Thermoplasmata archaeon]|nr:hypothetical protein [Thermoplasmata archaeon]
MRRWARSHRATIATVLLAVFLLAFTPLIPVAHAARGTRRAVSLDATGASGLQAVVTWGGTDVAGAGSMSSAIATSLSSVVDVRYNWTAVAVPRSGPGPEFNISTARLEMFYFGYPLSTRDVVRTNPVSATSGQFDMSWDPGILRYLLSGTYSLTASLIAPNGTTEWSEKFYLRVTAPGTIGAALPIILILIGIWEVYSLARSGRQAALGRPAPAPSKAPPTSPEKPATAKTEPEESADDESPPGAA